MNAKVTEQHGGYVEECEKKRTEGERQSMIETASNGGMMLMAYE